MKKIINLKVKEILSDDWSRPRLQDIKTGMIFADANCGDGNCNKHGIIGDWHTVTTDWGEPISRLKSNVHFTLVSSNEE